MRTFDGRRQFKVVCIFDSRFRAAICAINSSFYVQAEILKRNVNERKQKFASNQVANAQHFSECLRCGCRRLDICIYMCMCAPLDMRTITFTQSHQ